MSCRYWIFQKESGQREAKTRDGSGNRYAACGQKGMGDKNAGELFNGKSGKGWRISCLLNREQDEKAGYSAKNKANHGDFSRPVCVFFPEQEFCLVQFIGHTRSHSVTSKDDPKCSGF